MPCATGQQCDEELGVCTVGRCPVDGVGTCRSAAKSSLTVADQPVDDKDRLTWSWMRGAATTQDELAPGDPPDYAVCVYGEDGTALLASMTLPGTSANWKPLGTRGYEYRDALAAADGIQQLRLSSGDAGKAKIQVKGKGAALPDLDLPLASDALALRIQLRNGNRGVCWESRFTSLVANKSTGLRARFP